MQEKNVIWNFKKTEKLHKQEQVTKENYLEL